MAVSSGSGSDIRGVDVSSDLSFALVANRGASRVLPVELATGELATVAGSGSRATADGDTLPGGGGVAVAFSSPCVAISSDTGVALVVERCGEPRRIDLATNKVATVAGSGARNLTDSVDTAASFSCSTAITIAPDNSYALVGEERGHGPNLLRKVILGHYCKIDPTPAPTPALTATPTSEPAAAPTAPTQAPTAAPASAPTAAPTQSPTKAPTADGQTYVPTATPTQTPSPMLTLAPTGSPTKSPTT